MKKGTKIKLIPENITNDDFQEKIKKFGLDVLTVEKFYKVDEEDDIEYYDVCTEELKNYVIGFSEYVVIGDSHSVYNACCRDKVVEDIIQDFLQGFYNEFKNYPITNKEILCYTEKEQLECVNGHLEFLCDALRPNLSKALSNMILNRRKEREMQHKHDNVIKVKTKEEYINDYYNSEIEKCKQEYINDFGSELGFDGNIDIENSDAIVGYYLKLHGDEALNTYLYCYKHVGQKCETYDEVGIKLRRLFNKDNKDNEEDISMENNVVETGTETYVELISGGEAQCSLCATIINNEILYIIENDGKLVEEEDYKLALEKYIWICFKKLNGTETSTV